MDKKELLQKLEDAAVLSEQDPVEAHENADDLLLEYINDPKIRDAFDSVNKWYA